MNAVCEYWDKATSSYRCAPATATAAVHSTLRQCASVEPFPPAPLACRPRRSDGCAAAPHYLPANHVAFWPAGLFTPTQARVRMIIPFPAALKRDPFHFPVWRW